MAKALVTDDNEDGLFDLYVWFLACLVGLKWTLLHEAHNLIRSLRARHTSTFWPAFYERFNRSIFERVLTCHWCVTND